MTVADEARPGRPTAVRWLALIALSAAIGAALSAIRLPAALMLGPLVAAVVFQVRGIAVRVPAVASLAAQAVIGCLVARSITPGTIVGFAHHAPLFVGMVLVSVAASVTIGWTIARLGLVPGTTAVWGMLPGRRPR